MSIIERLTEGMVQRDMKQEGQALLEKWSRTGLLEGLTDVHSQHNMARLLENQAKELLREASTMQAGDVEGFAAVAFPIVRRVFAGLIANDLVSVQPMSLPSGLIFFLDFVYGDELGGSTTAADRFGNSVGASLYGTDRVGSQVTGGVNLVGDLKENLSGPRQLVGGAYGSPSGSSSITGADDIQVKCAFGLSGSISEASASVIQYDPDLMSLSDGTGVVVFDVRESVLTASAESAAHVPNGAGIGSFDLDNLAMFDFDSFSLSTALSNQLTAGSGGKIIRRLTKKVSAEDTALSSDAVRFVFVANGAAGTMYNGLTAVGAAAGNPCITGSIRDNITTSDAVGSVKGTTIWDLEGNANIPEIDIKVDSIAITAQTKKLKAKWTPELGQDLNAYHNLDAEVELTSILSEQIALEIDREILADLVHGATAGTFYWSRSPGLFVDRLTGAELGATAAAPDFTGTVSEWYETLIETINDVSAAIHRKTLRGGANFVVCNPEVANILEFTSGFRANVTADADKGEIGAVKVGSLSRKFDVMVDPYFPRNAVLVGRRGSSFLESGYVYAPYVPLQVTPTIFGVEDFVPRKGVMTRYAKKMVRPDMYGLVIVRGLLGESGAS
jgi:hypothetical protein